MHACVVEHPELFLVSSKSCALPCDGLWHGALSHSGLYCMGQASNSDKIEAAGYDRVASGNACPWISCGVGQWCC